MSKLINIIHDAPINVTINIFGGKWKMYEYYYWVGKSKWYWWIRKSL